MFSYYWKRVRVFFITHMVVGLCTTFVLIMMSFSGLDKSLFDIVKTLVSATFFLFMEFWFLIIPFIFYLLVLPAKKHNTKLDKYITFVMFAFGLYFLFFKSIGEYFFWDEFFSRYNFIAVDYLVYTQEVIDNVYESYPIVKILLAAFIFTCVLSRLFIKYFTCKGIVPKFKKRIGVFVINIVVCVLIACFSSPYWSEVTNNRMNNEIAKSGAYCFIYAFFHNELDYETFYATLPKEEIVKILSDKTKVGQYINAKGQPSYPNVVIVLMESMSSSFLERSGGPDNTPLTPNLSELASKGIFFSNTYAIGTRTVRGIEALTIAVPPLPGMSIVRRVGNENLYNIGTIFRAKGYQTEFIYGGAGFFDNMNYYFKNNGFDITDRTDFSKDEIRFSNAWGVSDEDLFAKAIKQADKKYNQGQKFFQFVLTTSNHRPYTYPEGTVDIHSGTNRKGAVKYADYSIGQFIKEAKTKAWFNNTVFIFIADHEAGSGGEEEIDPNNHKIPFIIYAPKIFQPRKFDKAISQIDALPTLLSLLNFSYENRFFGRDALDKDYKTRFFLINYQKIGYVEDDILTILKPVKDSVFYKLSTMEKVGDKKTNEKYYKTAISYYQSANDWKVLLKENSK